MTIQTEHEVADSGAAPEEESHPHDGLCANVRCRKGPDGTRGIVKSRRAKYCCPYCRVDVCRRSRPKPEQIEKPKRKRRRDAKWKDHAERQRAFQARHSLAGFPQGIRDLVRTRARGAEVGDKCVPAPSEAFNWEFTIIRNSWTAAS